MRQYETFELVFQGKAPKGSYVSVGLTAIFLQNDNVTGVQTCALPI